MSTARPKRKASSKKSAASKTSKAKASKSAKKKKPTDDAPPEDERSLQEKVVHWFRTAAAKGYGVSLGVHTLLLLALSFYVLTSMDEPETEISTGFSDEITDTSFDETFDISSDMPTFTESSASMTDVLTMPGDVSGIPMPGVGEGAGGTGDGTGGMIPNRAVSKGSFSVWTEPADPAPYQDYLIVIHVKVPKKITTYNENDLTGAMVGTDGYRTPIGNYKGSKFPKKYYGKFDPKHKLLALKIPGAKEKVKDTIQVESRVLKEKQTIEIVF
jgi:hypothetical protein